MLTMFITLFVNMYILSTLSEKNNKKIVLYCIKNENGVQMKIVIMNKIAIIRLTMKNIKM